MNHFIKIVCCFLLLVFLPLSGIAKTWQLLDGSIISGDLFACKNEGVVIDSDSDGKIIYSLARFNETDKSYILEKLSYCLEKSIIEVSSISGRTLNNVNFEAFTPGGSDKFSPEDEFMLMGPACTCPSHWNQLQAVHSHDQKWVDSKSKVTSLSFETNFSEARRGRYSDVLPVLNSTLTYFTRGDKISSLEIKGLKPGAQYDAWLIAYRDNDAFNEGQERLAATWASGNSTTAERHIIQ